jgi:bacteriocin-like protein
LGELVRCLLVFQAVTPGTAPPAPFCHSPAQTDAMLQRDKQQESNMERTNEKSIELTTKELDAVTGGKSGTLPTHLPPRNPFPWPTDKR